MELIKHERTIRRFICYALTLCCLSLAIHEIFFDLNEPIVSPKKANLEWTFRIIRDIGWYTAIILAVIYGVFLWRTHSLKSSLKYLVGGIVGFAFTGLFAFYSLSSLQTIQGYFAMPPRAESIVQQAYGDATLPLDRRHKITKYYAKDRFTSGETPPKYIGTDGELKNYIPTAEDQQLRSKVLYTKQLTEWAKEGLRVSIQLTIGAFLFSCIVGLLASALYTRRFK